MTRRSMTLTQRLALLAAATAALAPSTARSDGTPVATCSDNYTRAQILRNEHKLLQARDALRVCAQTSCKDFIVKDCTTWLDQVQAGLPSVVPVATDEAGNDVANVRVSMDGVILLQKIEGSSVEVNPGPHTFTFESSGGTRVDRQVVVSEGEKNKRISVSVARVGAPAAAPVSTSPPAPTPASPPVPTPASPPEPTVSAAPLPAAASAATAPSSSDASSGPPWKTIGLVTGGVGVVGLAIGTVFGLQASSEKNGAGCNSNSHCPDAAAAGKLQDAKNSADLSTVFFVVGGVLGAGGLAMWIFAPSSGVQASPSVGKSFAGVELKGSW
jgi:hypothetical protein